MVEVSVITVTCICLDGRKGYHFQSGSLKTLCAISHMYHTTESFVQCSLSSSHPPNRNSTCLGLLMTEPKVEERKYHTIQTIYSSVFTGTGIRSKVTRIVWIQLKRTSSSKQGRGEILPCYGNIELHCVRNKFKRKPTDHVGDHDAHPCGCVVWNW